MCLAQVGELAHSAPSRYLIEYQQIGMCECCGGLGFGFRAIASPCCSNALDRTHARLGAVQQGVKKPDAADFLPHYLERIAPRVQAEYIRQGRIGDAKAFQDLMDSQDGKVYTRNWTNAVRKIEMGDLDGAVPDLTKLYTSYPDGRRAQATKLEGGKYQIDMIDEATGKTVNSFALESGDLVRKAAMALRPEKLAEFLAAQEGKRTAEAASLNKSIELELLRQDGQEIRDDRRDERLATRLEADAARRAAGGGSLTPVQQRSNAEIDAAREAVAGLSPQEIARRTAKATRRKGIQAATNPTSLGLG